MLTFKNDFRGFVSCNRDKLEALFKNEDKTIEFISCDNPDRCLVRCLDTPLASNPHVCAWGAYQIAYDEDLIESLELNELEVWAIILHEIGHIIRQDPYDNYTSLIENQCDDYSTLFGLQFYLASALCKMSALFNEIDLEQRLKHLSKSIVLYRPEWTCGRYNDRQKAAIMFNLIEGMSYYFEEESSVVIGVLLREPRNNPFSLVDIESSTRLSANILIPFLEELLFAGLVAKEKPTKAFLTHYRSLIFNDRVNQRHVAFFEKADSLSQDNTSSAEYFYIEKVGGVFSVMIELTYNCSEKCIHCYNPGASRNENEKSERHLYNSLKYHDVCRIIDELYELGLTKVCLTGGDPFSHPDCWRIIEYLYGREIATEIYTNGQGLVGRETQLASFFPCLLGISIYSGVPAVHDTITRTSGSFSRSLAVVEKVSRLAIPTVLKCCIIKTNLKSYYSVGEIAQKNGCAIQYELNVVDSIDGDKCVSSLLRLSPDEYEVVLCDNAISGHIKLGEEAFFPKERKQSPPCRAGHNSFCITPSGELIPCCAFHMTLGNLLNEKAKDIINNSSALAKWRQTKVIYFEECGSHEYCAECSLCAGNNYSEHKDYTIAAENNCYLAKIRFNLRKKMRYGYDPLDGGTVYEKLVSLKESTMKPKRLR